jgi:glutaredoxin
VISVYTNGFNGNGFAGMTGKAVGNKVITYINDNVLQGQAVASLTSVEDVGSVYKLSIDINGNDVDSYATKDGSLLFPQAIDLNNVPAAKKVSRPEEPQQVVKNDKPKVELFVMSHCPFGTQIEKGILPVVKELKDKIDFEVKFVNYAMHGEKEIKEQLRQYCIQRDYNDKYLSYLGAFLEDGDSAYALKKVSLSESDLASCIDETDKKFKITETFNDPEKKGWNGRFPPFSIYDNDNQKYGVRGSPTLVINGNQVRSARDAQSLLKTICSAFNLAPEECSKDMSSFGTPAPGFGFDTQGGSATTAGCGA